MAARERIIELLASRRDPFSIPMMAKALGISDTRTRLLLPELVDDPECPVMQVGYGRPATYTIERIRVVGTDLGRFSRDGHREISVSLGRQRSVVVDEGIAPLLVEIDKAFGDGATPVTIMSCEAGNDDGRPWVLFVDLATLEAVVMVAASRGVRAARGAFGRHHPEACWQMQPYSVEKAGVATRLDLCGAADFEATIVALERHNERHAR